MTNSRAVPRALQVVFINSSTSLLDAVGDFTLRKLKCEGVRRGGRSETNTVSRYHRENVKMMMVEWGVGGHSEALLKVNKKTHLAKKSTASRGHRVGMSLVPLRN